MKPLSAGFYRRPADELAPALLGQHIVVGHQIGRIVEAEAYLGPEDLASHARFGRRPRNAVMFGPPGRAYIYLIYGMYDMFNVVAGPNGQPGAVLIRALELPDEPAPVGQGPGKLTRRLGITRAHNGLDLTQVAGPVYLARGSSPRAVARGPRIGVGYAGAWAREALRFWIEGHPAVSRSR
jgi:DNA-3-methyladenine glycosylase